MSASSIFLAFTTGLFTGGLTCLAVQGGLLATTVAQRQEQRLAAGAAQGGAAAPIFIFVAAKLAAYTALGALLGFLGSFFELSLSVRTFLQFAVAVFMIGTALDLLKVHPVFRYFIIQPPRFVMRAARRVSKNPEGFMPAVLGAFTVFIPCGTTQAMMAAAIATGSAASGAAILFAFILGTSPLFFILGYFAARLGDAFSRTFYKVAGVLLLLLALYTLDGAVSLTGHPIAYASLWGNIKCRVSSCYRVEAIPDPQSLALIGTGIPVPPPPAPTATPTVRIESYGYAPQDVAVRANSHIKLNIVNEGGRGCTQAFVIPAYGIQRIVPVGTSATVEFDSPEAGQEIAFMCSMGMYRGVIRVL